MEKTYTYRHILYRAMWEILILQTYLLIYNPIRCISKESDIKTGREFIEEVFQIKGEVYIPEHSFYGMLAGKKIPPKQFAVLDVKTAFPEMEVVEN